MSPRAAERHLIQLDDGHPAANHSFAGERFGERRERGARLYHEPELASDSSRQNAATG